MTRRSYPHQCSLAQALDIVGERWTLLLVHELLVGPQRFKDLLDALPGMGPKLLALRLKTLEAAGVVGRRVLPPPAGSTVYELTELGEQLRPAVVALYRWGADLAEDSPDAAAGDPGTAGKATGAHPGTNETRETGTGRSSAGSEASIRCGLFGIQHVLFRPDRAGGVHDTYEFRVDEETFYLEVRDGRATVGLGAAHHPDAVFSMDAATFWALEYGRATITGDPAAARRALEVLGMAEPELNEVRASSRAGVGS